MSSRDEILKRLRKQARDVEPPGAWSSRRRFDDPAERFVETLKTNKGEAYQSGSLDEALSLVGELLHEICARKIIADGHPVLEGADLPGRWPGFEWFVVGQSGGEESPGSLRDFAAAADAGLSVATAALAETGTVVIATGPGRSRLTGLLPPVHVVLAPTTHLSTDLFTWTALRPDDLPSSVTLISGPSKTADIEQTMAVGVHGPGRFIVILYDEPQGSG
ncbi:MAG: lactate utilization protein [Chloroflexota bacterium]|nr:MAG: lactate utilization protein [Chloroflexota bacterium]